MAFDTTRFAELASRRGLSLGKPLIAVERTGSTNDDAMAAARAGAPHGATFLAEAQTHGRGRRGASWSSRPGESLTFSVLLRPRIAHERVSALTLAVGLAVRDAVAERVKAKVGIKWPNDIVAVGQSGQRPAAANNTVGQSGRRPAAANNTVGDADDIRKLAGILLESQLQGSELVALVVGIGLNVDTRRFDAALSETATSLSLLDASDRDREKLLVDLLFHLAARLASYETSGLSGMLDELRAHDALLGKLVRSDQGSGVARGIDENGALLLQTPERATLRVVSGSISYGREPADRPS